LFSIHGVVAQMRKLEPKLLRLIHRDAVLLRPHLTEDFQHASRAVSAPPLELQVDDTDQQGLVLPLHNCLPRLPRRLPTGCSASVRLL